MTGREERGGERREKRGGKEGGAGKGLREWGGSRGAWNAAGRTGAVREGRRPGRWARKAAGMGLGLDLRRAESGWDRRQPGRMWASGVSPGVAGKPKAGFAEGSFSGPRLACGILAPAVGCGAWGWGAAPGEGLGLLPLALEPWRRAAEQWPRRFQGSESGAGAPPRRSGERKGQASAMKPAGESAPEKAAQDCKDLTSAPPDRVTETYLVNALIN